MEKSGHLLTLPSDRVAFWIVFVIGGDVGRGIHNVVEASFKTCCVPSDHCALLAQPGPGIGRFVLRTRWVISHYPRSTPVITTLESLPLTPFGLRPVRLSRRLAAPQTGR